MPDRRGTPKKRATNKRDSREHKASFEYTIQQGEPPADEFAITPENLERYIRQATTFPHPLPRRGPLTLNEATVPIRDILSRELRAEIKSQIESGDRKGLEDSLAAHRGLNLPGTPELDAILYDKASGLIDFTSGRKTAKRGQREFMLFARYTLLTRQLTDAQCQSYIFIHYRNYFTDPVMITNDTKNEFVRFALDRYPEYRDRIPKASSRSKRPSIPSQFDALYRSIPWLIYDYYGVVKFGGFPHIASIIPNHDHLRLIQLLLTTRVTKADAIRILAKEYLSVKKPIIRSILREVRLNHSRNEHILNLDTDTILDDALLSFYRKDDNNEELYSGRAMTKFINTVEASFSSRT